MGFFQERVVANIYGSLTFIQAIYIPADDLTDPAPYVIFKHLDATTVLSRAISIKNIYPAIDSLNLISQMLNMSFISQIHFYITNQVKSLLQRYRELQDILIILGLDELSVIDKISVIYSRQVEHFLFQPFFATDIFTKREGAYVILGGIIDGFGYIV